MLNIGLSFNMLFTLAAHINVLLNVCGYVIICTKIEIENCE